MKIIPIIALLFVSVMHAHDEVVAKARSGRFQVVQEYHGDFTEIIKFSDPKLKPVKLIGFPWPGIYYISPDENLLLRAQKTGSGESIALLYRIEKSGEVSEIPSFDESLWKLSDQTSHLKKKSLYHTGIADEISWSMDGRFLELTLRGSNNSKDEDGIECPIQYDLKKLQAHLMGSSK